MQQLIEDKLGPSESSSFLRELFLQWLPTNVQMVLVSAGTDMDLAKLAQLADKVLEVVALIMSTLSHSLPAPPPQTQIRE